MVKISESEITPLATRKYHSREDAISLEFPGLLDKKNIDL